MTSYDDITFPRQQPCETTTSALGPLCPITAKHAHHVNSLSTPAPCHLWLNWPKLTWLEYSKSYPWTSKLWLDQLTKRWIWPTLALILALSQKLLTRPSLLNFSHEFWFWTSFLHLKLQNRSTSTLIIVVSWKASFKKSFEAYPTSKL